MRTVAEGYGLEISRGGMALCPFHNERTPSAKIYPDALHCFGCGTHVDVIGFTQKMFELDKPIDAVKKLNDDYALHIESAKLRLRKKCPNIRSESEKNEPMKNGRSQRGEHSMIICGGCVNGENLLLLLPMKNVTSVLYIPCIIWTTQSTFVLSS